jgi:Fe-S oxidoreductase
MDVPLMSERRVVDVLYWVGCAGSFDPRGQRTTLAMFEILKTAGVDFAVLGEEEFCHCEWARRAGNEHVYQLMLARNLQTLQQYGFDRILTQCSHCFNTFKNEYPQFGADFPVVHHSQFIIELVLSGRLPLRQKLQGRVVWHDPCYLGRYNGDYETARHILRATGLDLVEMPRSRGQSLCCGAGGANFWFEADSPAQGRPGARLEQVGQIRLREALNCNADTLAVGCPFCALALGSAAQATDASQGVAIRDIAELVAELL